MNNLRTISKVALAVVMIVLVSSCTKNEDSAGYEYTPDMYRSPAIEAYVDYGIYKDKEHAELKELQSARHPAAGSIPYNSNAAEAAINMPYELTEPIKDYEASAFVMSPLKRTDADFEANLAEGKRIYGFMCVHCHGESGAGDGAVVVKAGHAAPGAYDGALKTLEVGKMFHTLTHGKGMMGSHASQLSKKERWQVILHVQALQNGGEYPSDSLAVLPMVAAVPDSANGID